MATLSSKKTTSAWIITILVLFIIAISFGITMRFNQGRAINLNPDTFYSIMTVHGVTMIGIWSCAGMMAVNYLLSRYVKTSVKLNVFAYAFTVVGVLMIWASTLIGKFHAGWTFLYPLPFRVAWAKWGTPLFLWGLTLLAVVWLVWAIGMVAQILRNYSLSESLAFQHLSRTKTPTKETPPFILISFVSLIGIIICLVTAAILMTLLFAEYYSKGEFINDPLLVKNLTYFFGHTIANEALYLGLATLYEIMPEVSGRPKFKTTWYVALGWQLSFFFILTAFFHHLYMDFVQPVSFQIIGQMASYLASIPSAVVTVLSVIFLVFGNKVKWNIVNGLFFLGVTGWIIGGVGALIDATISNNIVLHNTLWVPAHFHTYNAMGNVLFSLAFFFWVGNEFIQSKDYSKFNKLLLALLIIGGLGFVIMFYLGGANSIPRRYSVYPKELNLGNSLATLGGAFASVYLLAILWIFIDLMKKCIKVFSSAR